MTRWWARAAAVLLSLFLVAACGGGERAPEESPSPPVDAQSTAPAPAPEVEPSPEWTDYPDSGEDSAPADTSARLVHVRLRPDRIHRDSSPTIVAETLPRRATGVSMRYRFWINDQMVQESPDSMLRPGRLKKGDGIFADVILSAAGTELDRARTDLVLVENTNPEIEAIEFPEIKGPGQYVITVKATDPDGDPLTFELDGVNLPAWIKAEAVSGRILLEPGEDPPETLEFEVVVRDNDGGEARREVTLTFRPPPDRSTPAEEE